VTISVVIVSKNSGSRAMRAIDSVLVQLDVDDEIIFVDDQSTDSSCIDVVKKYEGASNLKIFKSSSQGISAARNLGNNKAKNDFIYVLDADDYLRDGSIQVVKECISSFPDTDVFYGDICVCLKDKVEPYFVYPEFRNRKCAKRRIMIFPVVPFKHSAVIYRKSIIEEIGGYDESLSSKVDIDLALRIIGYTNKIRKINSYLCVHQIHGGQVSVRRIRGMANYKKVFWKHEQSFIKKNMYLLIRFSSEFLKQFAYLLKRK
jgi:glycosyltransferase involved in cell wall biosynthesis